jgi:hypothetical protein
MSQYLLSVHSAVGTASEPMADDEMRPRRRSHLGVEDLYRHQRADRGPSVLGASRRLTLGAAATYSSTRPETPLSCTGPISVKRISDPRLASTTARLTSTSPGRAYSPMRAATFTVWP